ncbi:proprotein convertase P-domain-containing protein [Lysobacter tyrosinilyticus]
MKLNTFLLVPALGLMLPAVASADECTPTTYAVSGTITTNTGANLRGVVVRDGTSSSLSKSNGSYAVVNLSNGTYTITPSLGGYSFAPVSRTVTVNGAAMAGQNFVGTQTSNANPVASFDFTVSGLTATFTDTSTDADGSIASRLWNFGDGTTSNIGNTGHAYAAAGTYTVALTVTDNAGATNTLNKLVTVASGNGLGNGVPVTNLSAAAGTSVDYTMTVPARATNLQFATSGGSGDADLYVKFGAAPTDTSYDCRPYLGGNSETCTFVVPTAGTYYVRVKAYSAFSGLSLTGSYTPPGSAQTYSNSADYPINDNATVDSPITVAGRSGNCPANASVTVAIVHTYIGDLKVDLVAPDGTLYNLHNRTGASTDNINKTMTFDLSSEALNGTWNLRVNDNASQDTGRIDSWSITF